MEGETVDRRRKELSALSGGKRGHQLAVPPATASLQAKRVTSLQLASCICLAVRSETRVH